VAKENIRSSCETRKRLSRQMEKKSATLWRNSKKGEGGGGGGAMGSDLEV